MNARELLALSPAFNSLENWALFIKIVFDTGNLPIEAYRGNDSSRQKVDLESESILWLICRKIQQ